MSSNITGKKRKRISGSNRSVKRRKIDPSTIEFNLSNNEKVWDKFNTYYNPVSLVDPRKDLVSATKVKNFIMNDPCLDWIHLHYNKSGHHRNITTENSQLSILFKMGNKFEDVVVNYLKIKYPNDVKNVVNSYNDIKPQNMSITKQYMMDGVPYITQALLYNNKNHTFGVADLLVRSDWLNRLFEKRILDDDVVNRKAPNLTGNYHYVAIDIKWTTLELCSNGTTIRNSNLFPAYKGQLAIYNAAMGLIQGYTPPTAYILAKSWKYTHKSQKYCGYNCFDLLGEIRYADNDKFYLEKTLAAVKWLRDVRYHGHTWRCNPPSRPELYPNMCNKYDVPYHGIKNKISNDIDELTQMWMIGYKNRVKAHDNGIYKWSDTACQSSAIGIYGKKIGPVVNKILDINRSDIHIILPQTIRNDMCGWQSKKDIEFYVDFETINGCFYNENIDVHNSKKTNGLIFMIGVGYEKGGQWIYKVFSMNRFSIIEEKRIIIQFVQFITDKVNEHMRQYRIKSGSLCVPSLFHWGHAERTLLNSANHRHNGIWTNFTNNMVWIDMCKVFKDIPIVIKGAKNFGLKTIAKTMNKHGFIQTVWNNGILNNGLAAMMESIKYYKFIEKYNSSINQSALSHEYNNYQRLFSDVVQYNEVDCKVLWEIVAYLRNNRI